MIALFLLSFYVDDLFSIIIKLCLKLCFKKGKNFMNRNFYESEKRQRFSLRKHIGIGLCSVALGSFSLVHTSLVHADTVNDAQEVQEKVETNSDALGPQPAKQASVVKTVAPKKQNDTKLLTIQTASAQESIKTNSSTPDSESAKQASIVRAIAPQKTIDITQNSNIVKSNDSNSNDSNKAHDTLTNSIISNNSSSKTESSILNYTTTDFATDKISNANDNQKDSSLIDNTTEFKKYHGSGILFDFSQTLIVNYIDATTGKEMKDAVPAKLHRYFTRDAFLDKNGKISKFTPWRLNNKLGNGGYDVESGDWNVSSSTKILSVSNPIIAGYTPFVQGDWNIDFNGDIRHEPSNVFPLDLTTKANRFVYYVPNKETTPVTLTINFQKYVNGTPVDANIIDNDSDVKQSTAQIQIYRSIQPINFRTNGIVKRPHDYDIFYDYFSDPQKWTWKYGADYVLNTLQGDTDFEGYHTLSGGYIDTNGIKHGQGVWSFNKSNPHQLFANIPSFSGLTAFMGGKSVNSLDVSKIINGSAEHTINLVYGYPMSANLMGSHTTTYDGNPITINDLNKLSFKINDTPVDINKLKISDFDFSTDNGTWVNTVPTNVGTYNISFNKAGIDDVIKQFPNSRTSVWGKNADSTYPITSTAAITIAPATVSAKLVGEDSRPYDGTPITSGDLKRNHKIYVELDDMPGFSGGRYNLRDDDYLIAPVDPADTNHQDAGRYTITLTDQGKRNALTAMRRFAGKGVDKKSNVTADYHDFGGTATFTITPAEQVINVLGTQTGKAGQVNAVDYNQSAISVDNTLGTTLTSDDFAVVDQDGKPVTDTSKAGTYHVVLSDTGLAKLQTKLDKNHKVVQGTYGTLLVNEPDATATLTFIDDTTGDIIYSDTAKGKINDPIKFTDSLYNLLTEYTDLGYIFDPDKLDVDDTYKTPTNNFTVHFTHAIDTQDFHKLIKETVHFVYGNGQKAGDDVVNYVTFTRPANYDKVTKKVTFSDWTRASVQFDKVVVPKIEHYTSNVPEVDVTVTPDSENVEKTVTYSPIIDPINITRDVTETVHFVDENGKKLADDKVNKLTFTYICTKNEATGKEAGNWNKDTGAFDAVNAPTVKGYTADVQKVDPITITREDNDVERTITYHEVLDPVNKTKTITETIHFVDDNGKKLADDQVKSISFTYTGTKSQATGVEKGSWDKDEDIFDAVSAPTIKGYKPDIDSIAKMSIKRDSANVEKTITYRPIIDKVEKDKIVTETIHYVDHQGNKLADDTVNKIKLHYSGTHNEATGIDNGKWISEKHSFDAILAQNIAGYTPDVKQIDPQKVDENSKNLEFTIKYSKNKVSVNNSGRTSPGVMISSSNVSGGNGKQSIASAPGQTANNMSINGDRPIVDEDTSNVYVKGNDRITNKSTKNTQRIAKDVLKTSDKVKKRNSVLITATAVIGAGGHISRNVATGKSDIGKRNDTIVGNSDVSGSGVNKSNVQALPQTGNVNEWALVAMGICLISISLGVAGVSKKK